MERKILNNINKNEILSNKVEDILKNKDVLIQAEKCKELLENINVYFLTVILNKVIPDYDIITIISEYRKIDANLCDQMLSINLRYNEMDEYNNTSDEDIEYLLLKIDYIYGYISEKYGDIIL